MCRALFCLLIAGGILLPALIDAQYTTDFEDDVFDASDVGVSLTDQDDFYLPTAVGSFDWECYLYEDNEHGFPDNPDGGDQFVAGRGPGPDPATGATQYGRAQRDVSYGDGIWTIVFDIAVTFDGTLPTAQNIGSVSTQDFAPPAGNSTFIALARWDDVATAEAWNADYVHFDATGLQVTAEVPSTDFQGLATETWYRWSTTFDLDTNAITEISIEDIESGDVFTYEPVDWYLAGGPAGGLGEPTGFRLFAGSGTVEGNIVAIDNLAILRDCNGNGIDDATELDDGSAEDCNDNGVIDTCEDGLVSTVLLADDASLGDAMGFSIALDGGTLACGAPENDDVADAAGAAYLFEYDDGWEQVAKVTADDGAEDDEFGSAVALGGDVAVFGVYRDDDEGPSTGSAYVFRRDDDGDWSQEQKLVASNAASGDQFGWSVATDGSTTVVGARATDDPGSNAGSVYVFDYDAADEEWDESQILLASDGAAGDQFGRSVAVDGAVLVIGASNDDDAGTSSGAAYVFRFDDDLDEWQEETKLTASDAASGDQFGRTAAMSGATILIGAPLESATADNGGAAYVFRFDEIDDLWAEEAKLTATSPTDGARFGDAVSIDGSRALVGAPAEAGEGAAYPFEYDGETWLSLGRVQAGEPDSDDDFALSVAVSGSRMACGAPGAGNDVVEGGAVFFATEVDCNGNGIPDSCEIDDGTLDDDDGNGVPDCCESDTCSDGDAEFIRGDADGNGAFSALLDGLYSLLFAFAGGDEIPCMDAADTDDSGTFSAILDALYGLNFAFNGGPEVPFPGNLECGPDTTADLLDCETVSDACL